ncbi:MAG: S8 family peptidase [Gemmatimonadetes bacterium]|nr:S8 family peptidase [Gemmatimonadota bacterium]
MKPVTLIGLSLLALAACAPRQPVATPTPVPPPSTAQPPAATEAPRARATRLLEAPAAWQLMDEETDHVRGISAARAVRELLAGKQPKQEVVVAIIDSGVDTAHAALRDRLWTNPKEIAGNGKDDDGNGYVDDVHGWNFIGGTDGRDVDHDTYEVTRLYVALKAKCEEKKPAVPTGSVDCSRYPQIQRDFEAKRREAEENAQQVRAIGGAYTTATTILKQFLMTDSLSTAKVSAIQTTRTDVQQAQQIYLQLAANGITGDALDEARHEFEGQLEYGLNPSYDPRAIVGDNYADPTERRYGNTDVTGPDALHGTHVAGIIGAIPGNAAGVQGIAPAVRLMIVRTVPDGDERDKDVANAIRYAADNGARIINMSFGKAYSPYKAAVDEAVKYAQSKGVLFVHAAGNDAEDLGQAENYPSRTYLDGGVAENWIEVGASSWKTADSLAASFTNYGQKQVDVFAPGVDILSTVPGGGFRRESGTSMAAPVVSGLAALILAYYPNLSAADVKRIILESATRYPTESVLKPGGSGEHVAFGSLSATGGIVNAYNALKLAEQVSRGRPANQ